MKSDLTLLKLKTPRDIRKVSRAAGKGGHQWSTWVTQMVLEMLSHRTPPESIPANILTVCSLICPDYDIVKELPSSKFVLECRTVLAVETKTLGAYQIARASRLIMHHSDDTSRQGITFGNSISKIEDERGTRNVALSSAIVAVDGTAENQVVAIERTFAEGREYLRNWREVTERMFPNRQDLLDQIPLPLKLTLARFHNEGWIMTDTCNTARKFRRLLREHIVKLAKEEDTHLPRLRLHHGRRGGSRGDQACRRPPSSPPPPQRSPDAGDGGRSRRGASKSIFDVPRARGPPSSSPAPFVIVSRRSRFRLLLFHFRPQTKPRPTIIAVRFPFLMLNDTHRSFLCYCQALQTLRKA